MKTVARNQTTLLFSWEAKPVVRVEPGETLWVECKDASGDANKQLDHLAAGTQVPYDQRGWPRLSAYQPAGNNLSGPIYVEGAEPGDVLVVDIGEFELDPEGWTRCRVGQGPLGDWLKSPRWLITPIRDGYVIFNDRIRIPIRPMIGTIGTAPAWEATGGNPGTYGGNVDCPDITTGSRLYLPVYAPGALLCLGDMHAAQGYGEFCGTAIETGGRVALTLNVRKGHPETMTWPRVETADSIMTLVADKPLEITMRLAFKEMALWLEEEYGFDRGEAILFLTQVGDARICQACQIPALLHTLTCVVPKSCLPPAVTRSA